MFVWNHFTNDARVLRECTALAEEGYEVDLIAIHDRKNPSLQHYEKRNELFSVIRVKNHFPLITKSRHFLNKCKTIFKNHIILTLLSGLIICLVLFTLSPYFLLVPLALFIAMANLTLTKLPKYMVRLLIFLQMVKYGLKKKYDIYHSNDLNTLPQGWLCAKLLRLRRKPLIYDSHEVQTSRTGYNSKIYGILEKFYLYFVDVMIMENHTRAKYIEERYGFYPAVVHNYPIPTQPEENHKINLKQMLNIDDDEPILLYQGGIQTGRGLEQIVQAIPKIRKGKVVFIGDGRIKETLVQMVDEMNVQDRVHFLPKVPLDELLDYTRNAYLGFQVLNNVCFNHYSASSNKLFEYMMSGVPVIACSFPEIKKVVEKENIGICVDSHDPDSIAEGANYLIKNQEVHQEMRRNCFKARDKYNWRHERLNFLSIYEHIEYSHKYTVAQS
ncbi:hypothetical protein GCM10007096_07070 [Pullulanibacillus pueri]|uniref:Glycosyl transferase family 1 domain-containing protein n=2 Tax=Pullulanibacillus pueri TaxID=1437324 RepID=A0A8J2ZU92_9BACL|nr:hypothetical protein GCM10007096_07070 [Pullulanibacillus pueri]